MMNHAVVIAGAGPTGLMLAGELALAHIDVALVERRDTQDLSGSRAGGLLARTLEVFDQRGIAERFVALGTKGQHVSLSTPLDISDLPTRHNYSLALWQKQTERLLAEWVAELAVPIYRGCEVTDLAQDDHGVAVTLSDGRTLHARYLVGCDGGRSQVRRLAGIEFSGSDATTSYLMAEVDLAHEPPWGIRLDKTGTHAIGKSENGRARVVLEEPCPRDGDTPTLDEVRAELVAAYGTDYGVHSPTWLSRFSDAARQAAAYRAGRVLLAGDAAHVHSPLGGQGLNLGVQDAVNLGWKLAQVVHGTSPDSLLDTYHAERHPIGARVLRLTMALTALHRGGERAEALRGIVSDVMRMDEPRKRYGAMLSSLEIHYELGAGHPLLGRRVPDLDIVTAAGPQRIFALLHEARPVLLNLGAPLDIAAWRDRIRVVDAHYAGAWELPALGAVAAPTAILIRPDGHVAWIGTGTDDGLQAALTTWFGLPTGSPSSSSRA